MMPHFIQRAVISRTEAEESLKYDLIPCLREWFTNAFEWVRAILDGEPDRRATLGAAVIAGMIYDRFIRIAIPGLESRPGVRIEKTGRMYRVRIADKIWLRFKHLDNRLRSSNYRTKNQKRIYHQYDLFDVSDGATSLTFGYVTTPTGADVRGIYITCPKSWKENHWMIVIEDAVGGVLPFAQPTPIVPLAPAAAAFALPEVASRSRKQKRKRG